MSWGVPVEAVVTMSAATVRETRRYERAFTIRSALGLTYVCPSLEKRSPWVWLALTEAGAYMARVTAERVPRLVGHQRVGYDAMRLDATLERGFVILWIGDDPHHLRVGPARTVAWYISRYEMDSANT